MPIVGAFILPHGAIPLNPGKFPQYYDKLVTIHKSAAKVAEEILSLNPDIIFMTTPHGICLDRNYGIYLNTQAYGSADWEGAWKEYTVKVELADNEAKEILGLLKKNDIPAEGIVAYADNEPLPLRWGEVIPLWYLQQPYQNNFMNPATFPKCIILSMPRKRNTEPELMVNECLHIGGILSNYFSQSDKKVVIVNSADMSHVHKTAPIKLDIGMSINVNNKNNENGITGTFNTTAIPEPNAISIDPDPTINPLNSIVTPDDFEKALENWAKNPIFNENDLINNTSNNLKFLSCGFTEFLIMQGLLREIAKYYNNIKGNIYCNLHPTYFGMMVVSFQFTNN